MTTEDLRKIFSNPFYCLPKIHETFVEEHKPMVTEEEFIKTGALLIGEFGAEEYIKLLLENLKGNFVAENNPVFEVE